MKRAWLLLLLAPLLSACGGYQTGKALNVFDSHSFWCSWDNCDKPPGSGDSDDGSQQPDHSSTGNAASHSDSGSSN